MGFFNRLYADRLYAAAEGTGYFYYILPARAVPPGDEIALADALSNPDIGGSFVFSATDPSLSESNASAFVNAVSSVLGESGVARGFVWLSDPASITPSTTALFGLSADGSSAGPLSAQILPQLSLNMAGGMAVTLEDTTLILQNGIITFQGPAAPDYTAIRSATIPCIGVARASLRFGTDISRSSLYDDLNWGLQFAIPGLNGNDTPTGLWLPLASRDKPSAGDWICFDVTIDPSDPLNSTLNDRSMLCFTGTTHTPADTPTVLISGYMTSTGLPVSLFPVPGPFESNSNAGRLVFTTGCQPLSPGDLQYLLAPVGDFELEVAGAPADADSLALMGGLHGTEYIAFHPRRTDRPGDRLRFVGNMPAYAPVFPFPPSSPVSAPVDPDAPLLGLQVLTSWATVVAASGDSGTDGTIPYVAQPRGAPLMGRDPVINNRQKSLLGAVGPAVALPAGQPFPLAPYGLSRAGDGKLQFDGATIDSFEAQALAPTRRKTIGASSLSTGKRLRSLATSGSVATTPSGQLVTLDASGNWQRILLGAILDGGQSDLAFDQPGPDLHQAFSTGDLFLVIANGSLLGQQGSGATAGPAFRNAVTIGDWRLTANVGFNSYNDYRNVIIVKGRRGALYDPTSTDSKKASLVSSSDKWSMASAFAAPADLDPANPTNPPGPPDPMELPVLSDWLRRYFQAAADETDLDYFGNFNKIARDPDWTGVLILSMDCGLPSDLAGLAGGITDPAKFRAHHLGIQISPVANDPDAPDLALSASSSMFGLIHYLDPAYVASSTPDQVQPVSVNGGLDYEFRVLTLKVLFENSAVKLFQSLAQVTLNRLFGMPVQAMADGGNDANALILKGTYQDNNGTAVYSMGTVAPAIYLFKNNVLPRIEIDSADLSTLNDGQDTNTVQSLFTFAGYMDFAVIRGLDGGIFDVFSFGNADGVSSGRQGLRYASLGLLMEFPADDPLNSAFLFTTAQITFDVSTSSARKGCLYSNFALSLDGLVSGDKSTPPSASDWLTVVPGATFQSVDGGDWYGLKFRLDMGSPGALAGKARLTSYLLTAWSTSSEGADRYNAMVGLQLPGTGGGAKLISLQNVLKLSIGQIHLNYDAAQSSFLLMLTDIALRFLGILKIPPSGSTLFYLFGNPVSDGKPTGLGWYAIFNNEPKKAS